MLSGAAGTSAGRALATTSHGGRARAVRVRTFFTSSGRRFGPPPAWPAITGTTTTRRRTGQTTYPRSRSHADRPARRPHAHRAQVAPSQRQNSGSQGTTPAKGAQRQVCVPASRPQIACAVVWQLGADNDAALVRARAQPRDIRVPTAVAGRRRILKGAG